MKKLGGFLALMVATTGDAPRGRQNLGNRIWWRRRGHAVKRLVGLLALLVVAAGCTLGELTEDPGDQIPMTTASLVGTWHADGNRFITFKKDGTFTAISLPPGIFDQGLLSAAGFDPHRDRLDGSGTWHIDRARGESTGPKFVVYVDINQLVGWPEFKGISTDLSALRPGDGQVYLVFFYSSAGGESTTGYLKCGSDCQVPKESVSPTAS